MEFKSAKGLGEVANYFLLLSALYYFLRIAFVHISRERWPGMASVLKRWVSRLRAAHLYFAAGLVGAVAIHGWVMYLAYGLTIVKSMMGIVAAAIIVLMAATGFLIRRYPGDCGLRRWHRSGMILLFVAVFIHVVISKKLLL